MRLVRRFPNRVEKIFVKFVSWSSRVQWQYARNDGKSATKRRLGGNRRRGPLTRSRWICQDVPTKIPKRLTAILLKLFAHKINREILSWPN